MNNKAVTVALFTTFSIPCGIAAQMQQNPDTEVIEVVVQKRKQNIQKVGISVTALPSRLLERLHITDTVAVTQQVPNLQLNAWSPNLTIFNLRGVSQNSFTDNLEGPIAVYMDDAYVGSLNGVSSQLFDTQRVEVLRGPQGTLFGRNATGGLIHYLSRMAEEDYANGYLKAGFGSHQRMEFEAAYGNEISENLRGRIAVRQVQADGYIESAVAGIRAVGGEDNLSFKTTLQWNFAEDWQLDLLYKYSKDDDVPTGGYAFLPWTQSEIDQGYLPPELMSFTQNVILDGGEPPGGLSLADFTKIVFFNTEDGFTPVDKRGLTIYRGDHPEPHKHFSNIDGYLHRKIDSLTAKLTWDLNPDLNFESISHYSKLDKSYLEDGDGIPAPIIAFQTDMDYRQWSQELRLAGQNDGFRWQVGAYFLNMQHDGLAATVGNPVIRLANTLKADGQIADSYDPGTNSPQAIQDFVIDADNQALFAQFEWQLNEQLSTIAGLRWSFDDKQLYYARGFQDLTANIGFIQQAGVTPSDQVGNIDYEDQAIRLQLNYQMTPEHLLFASYNKGIKVGNWAFSAGVPVADMKHRPETLHAWEVGIKSNWLHSTRFNATAFYYDYQDYQAFSMDGLAPHIHNSDARVFGGELELDIKATDDLTLTFGAAFLDSEVDEIKTVGSWNSPVGGTVIDFPIDTLSNRELPNAPQWSFNYIVNYQLPLFERALSLQLDGVHYAEQYLEVTNGGGSYQQAYGLSNLRLFYQSQGSSWQVSVFVKNITDEVYKQYSLDLGMLGATAYYAPGRTSGASVHYRF